MKRIICYFTGTGNSLALARNLAKALDAELISIPKLLASGQKLAADEIGFVFPVYMFRAPHMVVRALQQIESADYLFAIANNGGAMGLVFTQMAQILAKSGKKLDLGVEIHMPDNYLPFGGAMEEDKQRELFAEADTTIAQTIESIKKREQRIDNKTGWFTKYVIPGILYGLGYSIIPGMSKSFKVTDKCTNCGICEKICPAKTIFMHNGKPQWNKTCEQCFACIQWCPAEAIEYGSKSAGKKRYHHPDVTLRDMLA